MVIGHSYLIFTPDGFYLSSPHAEKSDKWVVFAVLPAFQLLEFREPGICQ